MNPPTRDHMPAAKPLPTVPLSTLAGGDRFAIPACDCTGVLLGDPSYGSVHVRLTRSKPEPDAQPEVWVTYIAPGTAVVPLRQPPRSTP